jgi:low affinity Fe/Cu permease
VRKVIYPIPPLVILALRQVDSACRPPPIAFAFAAFTILLWLVTGRLFGFSDTCSR